MKIEKVETAWVKIKCDEPQGLSGGYMTHSTDALCRITTDDGIQGIGEGRGAPLDEICAIIHEVFTPLLENENPLHTQYLWDKLHRATHGESVEEIRQAFKEAMDFYLETCAERGEVPNKPYSGKLMLRVPPELHAAVATAAEVNGKSINQWAAEVLSKAIRM